MGKVVRTLGAAAVYLFLFSIVAYGSTVTIHFRNGQTVSYDPSEIQSITFSDAPRPGDAPAGAARPATVIIGETKTFDGVRNGMDAGADLPPRMAGDFTVEMSVKPAPNQQTHANIIDFNHRHNVGLVIQQQADDTNHFAFYCGNGSSTAGITHRLQTGVWQHILFQRQGTEIRLYLNGTLVQKQPCFSGNILYLPNSTVTVGYNKNYGRYFKGEIKDLKIR